MSRINSWFDDHADRRAIRTAEVEVFIPIRRRARHKGEEDKRGLRQTDCGKLMTSPHGRCFEQIVASLAPKQ